ncbi:MAG: YhfT family protein, partial [Brevinema sp.]
MDTQTLKIIVAAAVGAVSALLANRGLAVFNDAVRPVYPEELEGRMSRKAFFGVTFAL